MLVFETLTGLPFSGVGVEQAQAEAQALDLPSSYISGSTKLSASLSIEKLGESKIQAYD